MGPTKYMTIIIQLCLILQTQIYTQDVCTHLITTKPLNGYHCPFDSGTVQLSHVPDYICTHYCVSRLQCPLMSYYVNKGICLLHKRLCVQMVQDSEQMFSSIISYQTVKYECISWLPYHLRNISENYRFVHMVYRNKSSHVIRLYHKNEILPGRIGNSKVKTVSLADDTSRITVNPDAATEYVVVSDVCSIAWVPYVAGNEIPSRAVVGGQRADGGPLFVAALWTTNDDKEQRYSYGYYDPESRQGHALNSGPRLNASVDMMVEIWVKNGKAFHYIGQTPQKGV